MKAKTRFVMFAVLGMMLATSCSNEDTFVSLNNESQVTFSLNLEDAMSTRAISDGTGINKLIYAVFDHEGNRVAESDAAASFPFDKTFSLIKGEEYTAVFWAQNRDCNAYSISADYKTISVNYAGALNNDETRDAFFKAEKFTVVDDVNIKVVLKRPFAQLNMGVTEEDWLNAKNVGFEVARSSVEIRQAATTLNLVDGSVGGAEDVIFAVNEIPADGEKLKVDLDCDGVAEVYKYISMCYFLANDNVDGASQTTLDGLKFVLSNADGSKTFEVQDGLANAPVQRNYRTNIVSFGVGGSILTDQIDVKVTLDPLYDGENTLVGSGVWESHQGIYTEEALAGMTIELPEGWHIRNGYIVESMPENWTETSKPLYAKDYTIDGKGNTITFAPYNYHFVNKNVFAAADSKVVTVKDVKFAGEHFGIYGGVYGGVAGRNAYVTVFEGVEIVGNGIYCYNSAGSIPMSAFSSLGTATLNGCTIKDTYWVGVKDQNVNGQNAYDNYGIYDIFVPNNKMTTVCDSEIGSINVQNNAHLTINGTSVVDKVDANALVAGSITVQSGATVSLLNVEQYSASYAPTVKIEAGATIQTLKLNSIVKTNKLSIDDSANIGTIIHKGVEYTSIQDFKNSL